MTQVPFRFKQFDVAQHLCSMRVNTDGVLLGAWACFRVDDSCHRALDIGTGSGVIGLMLAQCTRNVRIDAIDIDELSSKQADMNFANSDWRDRLNAYHTSLQLFLPEYQYDLIVSNPPYFVDDLKSDDSRKNLARHGVALSYPDLLKGCYRLLSESGSCYIVIPDSNAMMLQAIALEQKLFVNEILSVSAIQDKAPYLSIFQLQKFEKPVVKSTLYIQSRDGQFSEEYVSLTKSFYLKF
ncbi:MAG: methyltransferase [Bacteroidetes bacterium]|nr:methyltransferase [Bacteroidota bacterium]